MFVSKLKHAIKPGCLEWFKWFANWKSTLCEWFEKIMERRIILPRIRRFEVTQSQWFEKIMERRIFTEYRTRLQDKEVIWFLWQCQTINNYSYCLSLSMVFYIELWVKLPCCLFSITCRFMWMSTPKAVTKLSRKPKLIWSLFTSYVICRSSFLLFDLFL